LAEWLIEQQVEEAVMESTAQYWKPVWEALERYWNQFVRSGRMPAECLEDCISRKPCPIAGAGAVRTIFGTLNVW
jgi:hypothetical protein